MRYSSKGFLSRSFYHAIKAAFGFTAALAAFCWCCAFAASHSSFVIIAMLAGGGLMAAAWAADEMHEAIKCARISRNWTRHEAEMRLPRL